MSKKKMELLAFGFVIVLLGGVALWRAMRDASRRAASIDCSAGSMKQICLVATLWAEKHDQKLPVDFLSMSNELHVPGVLICQGERRRRRARDWAGFTPANSSYEIVSPGAGVNDTNTVFVRCTVHGHLGYADGRVEKRIVH